VRGAFLMQLGRNDEARVAFDRAIALANTSAEAAHIRMHLDRLPAQRQHQGVAGEDHRPDRRLPSLGRLVALRKARSLHAADAEWRRGRPGRGL
jgi:hypothetical protein